VINVDGFQGRENDIIILSFVRSNTEGNIGFARHSNRLNVAISRAKFLLVMVANLNVFRQHKSGLWKSFLNLVDDKDIAKKL